MGGWLAVGQVLMLTQHVNAMSDATAESESALRDVAAYVSAQQRAAEEAVARGEVPTANKVVPRSDVPLFGVPRQFTKVCGGGQLMLLVALGRCASVFLLFLSFFSSFFLLLDSRRTVRGFALTRHRCANA